MGAKEQWARPRLSLASSPLSAQQDQSAVPTGFSRVDLRSSSPPTIACQTQERGAHVLLKSPWFTVTTGCHHLIRGGQGVQVLPHLTPPAL